MDDPDDAAPELDYETEVRRASSARFGDGAMGSAGKSCCTYSLATCQSIGAQGPDHDCLDGGQRTGGGIRTYPSCPVRPRTSSGFFSCYKCAANCEDDHACCGADVSDGSAFVGGESDPVSATGGAATGSGSVAATCCCSSGACSTGACSVAAGACSVGTCSTTGSVGSPCDIYISSLFVRNVPSSPDASR